jgi:hypothetical protein
VTEPDPAPSDAPDVGFTLGMGGDAEPPAPPRQAALPDADECARQLADALAAAGPPGWRRLAAEFALTVGAEAGQVEYTDGERTVQVKPSAPVLDAARRQRRAVAESADGPWWRLLLSMTDTGDVDLVYDYGEEPFPAGRLFEPETYRADVAAYPRPRLPVWLAAYLGHADRQSRSPAQAAAAARADAARGIRPTPMAGQFPDFPLMWARWATIAAAFAATGSTSGPRITPATAWFDSSRRDGATLSELPGRRAVLSGGVWEAPNLDAAYNGGAHLPNLYAGAPDWVANPVLNARAGTGLLSFCYWWDEGRWHRGESPSAAESAHAMPGVWSADTVAGIVAGLAAADPTPARRSAAATLVSAAEVGVVTRDTVLAVFGDEGRFDVDGACYQLSLAGLTASMPRQMSAAQALSRVRDYLCDQGLDTARYPPAELVADRFSVGWMVYLPVPRGRIAIGRTIFYVADDGVLERSTSSVAPATFIVGFEERFRRRRRAVVGEDGRTQSW